MKLLLLLGLDEAKLAHKRLIAVVFQTPSKHVWQSRLFYKRMPIYLHRI